jgi:hypothetical protein
MKLPVKESAAFPCYRVHLRPKCMSVCLSTLLPNGLLNDTSSTLTLHPFPPPPSFLAVRAPIFCLSHSVMLRKTAFPNGHYRIGSACDPFVLPEYGQTAFAETLHNSECEISKPKRKFFKHFCNPVIMKGFLLTISAFLIQTF